MGSGRRAADIHLPFSENSDLFLASPPASKLSPRLRSAAEHMRAEDTRGQALPPPGIAAIVMFMQTAFDIIALKQLKIGLCL